MPYSQVSNCCCGTQQFSIPTQGDRDIDVRLDFSFHALKCAEVDFRVEDSKGVAYDDLRVHLVKQPIGADGALMPISDTTEAPACRVFGTMSIKRVTGAMHVAAPRIFSAFGMPFGFPNPGEGSKFNASHTISHLSFGPEYPSMVFPLNGHTATHTEAIAMYQYHVKVVPTVYESLSWRVMDTNQFSASDFTQELVGVSCIVLVACEEADGCGVEYTHWLWVLARQMWEAGSQLPSYLVERGADTTTGRRCITLCLCFCAVICVGVFFRWTHTPATPACGFATTSAPSWCDSWRRGTAC